MPWTEHQQRMLRAMGHRVWAPPSTVALAPALVPPPAAAAQPAATVVRPTLTQAAVVAQPVRQPPLATPLPPLATVVPAAFDAADRAVGSMDWTALRATVAGCRACGLCESRSQTVFGVGHPNAHWMVVGEAPGEQEDRQGDPFVGPAGQLLDRMLAALHLTRASDGPQPPAQRVYIANALKCRPPRNRNPESAEMARCEPYLVRQIQLLQPRLILAMGRFAVQALLRSTEPVGKLRGRVHTYQGVPLVVTYHPAYLLRNLADKAKAWDDLCLAARVVQELDLAAAG